MKNPTSSPYAKASVLAIAAALTGCSSSQKPPQSFAEEFPKKYVEGLMYECMQNPEIDGSYYARERRCMETVRVKVQAACQESHVLLGDLCK